MDVFHSPLANALRQSEPERHRSGMLTPNALPRGGKTGSTEPEVGPDFATKVAVKLAGPPELRQSDTPGPRTPLFDPPWTPP
jgi:hypothetical protein